MCARHGGAVWLSSCVSSYTVHCTVGDRGITKMDYIKMSISFNWFQYQYEKMRNTFEKILTTLEKNHLLPLSTVNTTKHQQQFLQRDSRYFRCDLMSGFQPGASLICNNDTCACLYGTRCDVKLAQRGTKGGVESPASSISHLITGHLPIRRHS